MNSLEEKDRQFVYEKSERIEFTRSNDKLSSIIFDKGDAGNYMYVLIDGIVDIIIIDIDGHEKIVHSYNKPGDFFGEQSLLDNLKTRAARAVIASDSCVLQKINKKEFDQIILAKQDDVHHAIRKLSNQFIQEDSPVFSRFLVEQEKNKTKKEEIEKETLIVKEGDAGSRFYLILEGRAKVFKNGKLIGRLIKGNYFGGTALINKQPHQMTIVASDDLKVVSIDNAGFLQLYKSSTVVREYIQSVKDSFKSNEHDIVYTQYQSHYKNQHSSTTILTYPNGEVCSVTKVVTKNYIVKIAMQVDVIDEDGNVLGKKDIEFREQDRLKSSILDGNLPIFYLQNNRLVGAEINVKYGNLDHIVPAIIGKLKIGAFQRALYRVNGDLWIKSEKNDLTDNAVICSCMGVTQGELKRRVSFGCNSFQQLVYETGASMACGSCTGSIVDIAASAENTIVDLTPEPEADSYCNKSRTIKKFRFRPRDGSIESYFPGQHIRIESNIKGQQVQRIYTLTSDASQKKFYEIAVRRTDNGIFSNWLHDELTKQSKVYISRPQGQFHLNPDTTNPIVFFVAGVGVTPAISFLRYLSSINHKAPLYIDYSFSTEADIAFENELKDTNNDWFKVNLRLTERRQSTIKKYNGPERRHIKGKNRVSQKVVSDVVKNYQGADFYICGSKSYDEVVKTFLFNCGIEEEKIHSEQFNNSQKRSGILLIGAILALVSSLLFFVIPAYTPPVSVKPLELNDFLQNFSIVWRNFDLIRQQYFPRDITGFSMLGLGLTGLLMSLPRRWGWVRKFEFGSWRLMHVWLGVCALIVLFLHTGFAMGGMHTTLLISCFLALLIMGSITSTIVALQSKLSPVQFYVYKKWFKRLHIAVCWPMPILLGFHILSTYWF